MNYFISLMVVVFAIVPAPCECGSYWEELVIKKIGRNRYSEYCQTHEGIKIFKGSVVKFLDTCFVCECSDEGLYCSHPFGMHFMTPFSCKRVIDGCKSLYVDARNEFLRCITRTPLNKPEVDGRTFSFR